jgi:hypothetical protein
MAFYPDPSETPVVCVLFENQRKESPMEHGHLSRGADQFHWVFAEALLNACGKDGTLCRRQRLLTPCRLGLALTATCASQRGETSADFPCGFNALFGPPVTYKAFYTPVAKPPCADFARLRTARLISAMTLQGLGCKKGRACAALRRIVLQDGSSFALHDGWREVLPGRGKGVKPAAVALQPPLARLGEAPTTGGWPPAPPRAHAFGPAPPSLRASVLLADRGSVELHSLRRVPDEGGFWLIRAKAGLPPQGLAAFREDGPR